MYLHVIQMKAAKIKVQQMTSSFFTIHGSSSSDSDVEAVASLLKRFLGLEELQQRRQQEKEDYGEDEEDSLDISSDSAEEREEH